MADYYYYSDHHQHPANYQYNQYYSSYDYSANGYEQSPTPSLVGYYYYHAYDQHEFPAYKNANFHEPDSTGFVTFYSVKEANEDLDLKEFNPQAFHGGYNMSETYGEPLPPSDEICYPPSKIEPKIPPLGDFSFDSIPPPYGKKPDLNLESEEKPTNENSVPPPIEAKPVDGSFAIEAMEEEEEEQEEEQEEEEEEEEEEQEQEIRRQIPPGYGLEAMDLCEGVFGGYFPCLWKRKQGIYDQSGGNEFGDCDYWKGTADYLFGNPNPYGGSMPERGSYGDPVYSYQRHYPQQPLCEQVENGGSYSWLPNPRYY